MNKKRKDKRGGGGSPDADENGGGKPPSFDSLNNKRGSKRKVYDSTYLNPNELSNFNPNSNNLNGSNNSNAFLSALKKKAGPNDLSRLEKMVPTRFPTDHPFNKDSYRYYLVEPDPHSPHRQKFEETELWAGKPLPGHLYRLFLEPRVVLSLHDRAPQLRVNDERLAVTGEKGYAMVRGTHGVSHGSWYYEVSVRGGEMPSGGAVRLGWAQKLANLQAPCGYDKFSYAWRSRKGTVFHDSKGRSYSRLRDSKSGGWGHDDVIGCLITLPVVDSSKQILPDCCKNMTLVKFKNHLYYEEKDYFSAEEKQLVALPGSRLEFFKNGVSEGVAFTDIYGGVYFPAISIYKSATVVVNYGPDFKCPPAFLEPGKDYTAMSALAEQRVVENTLADIVYHVVNEQNGSLGC